ncbi:MAG: 50S ribosomal protein L29 [Candidatus Peribacteraceae bacterium]|nr:50S ribosomal protein L29 [Candidatus Peribacteraceae bacterium]
MTKSSPIAELKRMSAVELRKELSRTSASYARHRIGITMQSEKNHAACRLMRRDIARMTMVLHDLEKNRKSEKNQHNQMNIQRESSSVSSDSSLSSGSSAEKPVKRVRSKSKKAA